MSIYMGSVLFTFGLTKYRDVKQPLKDSQLDQNDNQMIFENQFYGFQRTIYSGFQ